MPVEVLQAVFGEVFATIVGELMRLIAQWIPSNWAMSKISLNNKNLIGNSSGLSSIIIPHCPTTFFQNFDDEGKNDLGIIYLPKFSTSYAMEASALSLLGL